MGCCERIVVVHKDKDPKPPLSGTKLLAPKHVAVALQRLMQLTTVELGSKLTATMDPKIQII